MIAAIIPAYNEQNTISTVISDLLRFVNKVIVVDDGSSDETAKRAEAAGATVLKHIVNRGYGAGLATGTEYALNIGAQYLIHFDADGQFVASDVPKLLDPLLKQQAQVVFGSRFLGRTVNIPFSRKIILKAAIIFTWAFSGLKLTDAQNGFRSFTNQAARLLDIRQDGKAATSEIIDEVARLKLKYVEVPVIVYYTNYSLNKPKANNVFDIWRIVRDLFVGKIIK